MRSISSPLLRVALVAVLGLPAASSGCADRPDPPEGQAGPSPDPSAVAPVGASGREGISGGSGASHPSGEAAGTRGGAPVSADAERLRVVVLGTSLTAGLGLLRDDDRWTARVASIADSAGLPVDVVNAGVSGETSAGGLRRLEWLLEDPLDVLVVELGANDGLRGQDPAALESNLREIVRRTRERRPDARVVLTGMEAPPNMGAEYTRRFREVYGRLARELDVPLVPFLLEGVAADPALNQSDGIHPNARGQRRIARNVWPVLEPVLREELGGSADSGPGSGDEV